MYVLTSGMYVVCQILNVAKEALNIIKCSWPPPFMDALHFVCIHMYALVIYDMTKALHSLGIEVHFLLTQEEVIIM